MNVPLKDNSTSGCGLGSCQGWAMGRYKDEEHTRATCREDDASDFSRTLGARRANLDDNLWIVNIVELASSTGDDSPGFAEDVNSSWDL